MNDGWRDSRILRNKINDAIEKSIEEAVKTVNETPRLYDDRATLKVALRRFGEVFKEETNRIRW